MTRWQTLDKPKASFIRYGDCVYVVFIEGKVSYVGKTNALYQRLYRHRFLSVFDFKSKSVTVKYSFDRKYAESATRELRLIALLNPPLNRAHKRNMNLGKPWLPDEVFCEKDAA